MAIQRVSVVTPTAPVGVADYQAIIAQLEARLDAFSGREIVTGTAIKAGTVLSIGGIAYKATSDTAITGTPSAYVKITPAGATASAAFVASLSGVVWSYAYGGFYDGSGNLYVFDEELAIANGAITTIRTKFGRVPVTVPHGLQVLTGSGNFTVPANVFWVKVTTVGGGGNGGNGSVTGGGGGGGGSGGREVSVVACVPSALIAYVCGAAGASTTFTGATTAAGGSTGSLGSTNGGNGGAGGGNNGQDGASGGSVMAIPSMSGYYGGVGGLGGGPGGGRGGISGNNNGVAGTNGGGGGGGGGAGDTTNAGSGGAGGSGYIVVEW